MSSLRSTIASLRAVTVRLAGIRPFAFPLEAEYLTLRDGTPALLDALDRIAAVVDRTDPSDGTNDYQALDEIRAILDGAQGETK